MPPPHLPRSQMFTVPHRKGQTSAWGMEQPDASLPGFPSLHSPTAPASQLLPIIPFHEFPVPTPPSQCITPLCIKDTPHIGVQRKPIIYRFMYIYSSTQFDLKYVYFQSTHISDLQILLNQTVCCFIASQPDLSYICHRYVTVLGFFFFFLDRHPCQPVFS